MAEKTDEQKKQFSPIEYLMHGMTVGAIGGGLLGDIGGVSLGTIVNDNFHMTNPFVYGVTVPAVLVLGVFLGVAAGAYAITLAQKVADRYYGIRRDKN